MSLLEHSRTLKTNAKLATKLLKSDLPLLVIDGVVAGLWQQRRIGRRLEIGVKAFVPVSRQQHEQLETAVARIEEIVEAECMLILGAITARPHR